MPEPADQPDAGRRNPVDPGVSVVRRCPECGAVLRAGLKRCEFCGRKVSTGDPGASPRRRRRKPATAAPLNLFRVVGIVCLIAGIFVVVQRNAGERGGPAPPRQIAADTKQQAYKVCEEYIRRHPPATFAVTSIASGLVAEERGGFAVSGTVELQDPAGAGVRRRFSCKVLTDARSGLVVGEGKIY